MARRIVGPTILAAVLGCAATSSPSALRPWASRNLRCPENEIAFKAVGGDCLDKPIAYEPQVAGDSDCDLAARGCDRYMKFVHAPGGGWWEVRP